MSWTLVSYTRCWMWPPNSRDLNPVDYAIWSVIQLNAAGNILTDQTLWRSDMWSCMPGGLREVVLSFKFRQNRLNGFRDVGGGVEICHFLYLRPVAYITACTTYRTSRDYTLYCNRPSLNVLSVLVIWFWVKRWKIKVRVRLGLTAIRRGFELMSAFYLLLLFYYYYYY